MALTATVTGLGKRPKHGAAQLRRYRARVALWQMSELRSVRGCGRYGLRDGDVTARVSEGDGVRLAGFGGVQTCGSVWSCPVCSAKIAAVRQVEVDQAVRAWEGAGGGLGFVTVTMRHSAKDKLSTLWDALAVAWNAATSGEAWADEQGGLGVPMSREVKSGKSRGEVRESVRVPIIRTVEVTHGKSGWHVHVHALLFLRRPVTDATVDQLADGLFDRWRRSLIRQGLRAPIRDKGGLDARAATAAAGGFGDYFTKATYGNLARELVRGDMKQGKGQSRTPFELLAAVVGEADYVEGDRARWREWELGSKGRRQLTWSPGLRELVAVAPELTDLEAAALEYGGRTVAVISREEFSRITADPRLYMLLLELLGESDTLFRLALDVEGIAWTEPAD